MPFGFPPELAFSFAGIPIKRLAEVLYRIKICWPVIDHVIGCITRRKVSFFGYAAVAHSRLYVW
jgi:hypothetical protein